ncbi:MAG TPA: hypothetical protein VKA49_08740 [Flavitalea sp.]|nr:hypothetical protein [Flavitalea sp.]
MKQFLVAVFISAPVLSCDSNTNATPGDEKDPSEAHPPSEAIPRFYQNSQ